MEILLNPGPVNLSQRVRLALLRPDLCHREIEFSNLQHRIRNSLLHVYDLSPADWTAVLITGSGTAAMEAMMISLLPQDCKVLIIETYIVFHEVRERTTEAHPVIQHSRHFNDLI